MIYGSDDGSVSRQAMRYLGWSVGLARCMALLTIAGLLLGSCRGMGTGMGTQGTPAAPVPVLGSHDDSSATVTWSEPDTDLKITGYELRWRQASDTAWNQVRNLAPTTKEYTITKLQPGTEYEVQVRAVFATDVGAWSQSITVTTEAPDPTPVVSGISGLTIVKIEWSEPDTDLEITGYELRWRQALDTTWNEVGELDPTTREYKIGNLPPPADYEVQVRAVFASGGGTWSASVMVSTITPDKIYWVEVGSNTIKRADLNGNDVETLVDEDLDNPAGIALSANKMYWTDYGNNTIKCADLEGTVVKTLVTGLSEPSGIALDVAGGKMYWTETGSDPNNDTIKRADLGDLDDLCEGGDSVEAMVTNANDPQDLALDVAERKMYWTDRGTGNIKVASMDGGGAPETLITNLTNPQGIALDLANGVIYWTETGSKDDVRSANLEDVADRTIIENDSASSPHGMAIDGVNDKVYWVDYDADTIESADLGGGNHQELMISVTPDKPRDIALGR